MAKGISSGSSTGSSMELRAATRCYHGGSYLVIQLDRTYAIFPCTSRNVVEYNVDGRRTRLCSLSSDLQSRDGDAADPAGTESHPHAFHPSKRLPLFIIGTLNFTLPLHVDCRHCRLIRRSRCDGRCLGSEFHQGAGRRPKPIRCTLISLFSGCIDHADVPRSSKPA